MGLPFAELEWDEWNEAHIARHGVTSREVYEAAFDPRAIFRRVRKSRAPRYLLLGTTSGGATPLDRVGEARERRRADRHRSRHGREREATVSEEG